MAEIAPLMAPFLRVLPKKKRAEEKDKSESDLLPVGDPTRIGFGEYSHPTEHDKAGHYARTAFIEKIEEFAQEVLVDLAESVRPNYERIRAVMDQDELLSLDAETLRKLGNTDRNEFAVLIAALEDWIKRHSLNTEWVRNMVLRTLFEWTGTIVVVPGRRLQFSAPISVKKSKWAEMPFSFSDNGWRITDETEKAFVARVSAEFNSHLGGYVRRVRSQAEEAGWTKTPKIRKSDKDSDLFRHFEWLVRWQCQRWTHAKIAKEYGLNNPRKLKRSERPTEIPKRPTEILRSASKASERSAYAEQSDLRRQAAYRAVHKGIAQAAHRLALPLRPGNQGGENNL
ncbi:MAG: hypothetical protein ACJ8AK_11845 [Gemmatimonadaceae bacterium]